MLKTKKCEESIIKFIFGGCPKLISSQNARDVIDCGLDIKEVINNCIPKSNNNLNLNKQRHLNQIRQNNLMDIRRLKIEKYKIRENYLAKLNQGNKLLICSNCGYKNLVSSINQQSFSCINCGHNSNNLMF